MPSILNQFFKRSVARASREHLIPSPVKIPPQLAKKYPEKYRHLEELVILGVLLSLVGSADEKWLPEEEEVIRKILVRRGVISEEEVGLVLAAAREALETRPEIQGFTREVNKRSYEERLRVVELLFHVALADHELAVVELEMIRKIANLLWVSHKDFIDTKVRVKKEYRTS